MARSYTRHSTRASWSPEAMTEAATAVSNGSKTIWQAAREFRIPYRTLKRRIATGKFSKGRLGRCVALGSTSEIQLVQYIIKLQRCGFPMTCHSLRKVAFDFAQTNGIRNNFNKEKQLAGRDWMNSFMRRHPHISLRKAEGTSQARCLGMCREAVGKHFQLLLEVLQKHNILGNPGSIYNVDETGLQLNNTPGKVIAEKGSKAVFQVTSAEKGETISLIVCCNAEGSFLPPRCIFKGKRKKPEFEFGLPSGADVVMGETSAYVNSGLFFDWLQNFFIPRKNPGKVLLILDGHRSHCTNIAMLDHAEAHDVILYCLPAHTTHYLQPLDRSFFKSLKNYWYGAVSNWMISHPGQRVARVHFGTLLKQAWNKAASVGNGSAGFAACGIHPFNPDIIPDYAYSVSESAVEDASDPQIAQEQVTLTHLLLSFTYFV